MRAVERAGRRYTYSPATAHLQTLCELRKRYLPEAKWWVSADTLAPRIFNGHGGATRLTRHAALASFPGTSTMGYWLSPRRRNAFRGFGGRAAGAGAQRFRSAWGWYIVAMADPVSSGALGVVHGGIRRANETIDEAPINVGV